MPVPIGSRQIQMKLWLEDQVRQKPHLANAHLQAKLATDGIGYALVAALIGAVAMVLLMADPPYGLILCPLVGLVGLAVLGLSVVRGLRYLGVHVRPQDREEHDELHTEAIRRHLCN